MLNHFRSALTAAAVATLVALPTSMYGQQKSALSFGVSGGLSAPVGSLGNAASSGYNITGHLFLSPSVTKALGFRADLSYDSWGGKGGGFTLRSLGGSANGIYHFSDTKGSVFSPYGIGGVGLYNVTTKVSGSNASSSSTDFGLQAGAGVEFQLASFSTFGEVKFVNVFETGGSARWFPVTFGVRF